MPQTGDFEGDYVVRIYGFNFQNGTILCKFGNETVSGTYVSDSEVTCRAPAGPAVPENHAIVAFSLSIDEEHSINQAQFHYFSGYASCINGFCSGGFCFCSAGFTGSSCDEVIDPPVLQPISDLEVVAGDAVMISPVLISGTATFSWGGFYRPFGIWSDN